MEISKKDLLKETGISYGQLYRWKREGLIPEEWFMKRSAFTGQETFFPRDKIIPRVQAILEMKERHSLEEMAKMFEGGANAPPFEPLADVPPEKVKAIADFPDKMKLVLSELFPDGYDSERQLLLYGLASLIAPLGLSLTETKALVSAALTLPMGELPTLSLRLWSGDRPHYFLTLHACGTPFFIDSRFRLIGEVSLDELSATLKDKLNGRE